MRTEIEINDEIEALKQLRAGEQFRQVEDIQIDRHLQADAAAAALKFDLTDEESKAHYTNDYELTAALNAINWRDGNGRPVSELIK